MALVILASLPPLIFAVVVLLHNAESQRDRAEHSLVVGARGVARAIDAEFATALATLNVLKSSTSLDSESLGAFEQRLQNTMRDTGRGFALISAAGQQLISTMPPPRQGLAADDASRLAAQFEGRKLYISDVITDSGSQEPFVLVGVPIVRDGTAKWLLASFLYSGDFAGVVAAPGVPDDWIVSIVDRHGRHIRRSHFNEKFAGHPLVPGLVKHIAAKQAGVIRTTSLEGIPLTSTVAYAPLSNWAAAVGLPIDKLEAPLRSSLRSLLLTGFVVAALALTLGFFVARMLDRGFAKLGHSAGRLDRGELVAPQHSAIREVNEVIVTMLHVSHNLMERGKALSDLADSLETQVAERTAELVAEMQRREKSEAQLRQLQRMEAVGNLTGGVAHDFSNMLAVVMSGLSLIQRHLARGDTDVQKFIDGAMQGAEGAANLTRRLLAFSRQQALSPESVDCNKLISDMSDLLQRTMPEHIEIRTILADGLWRSHIDVPGLENAILNLVVNARDAMPDGGGLMIETSNVHLDEAYAAEHTDVTAGEYVMVEVTDTGTGISKDIQSKVFEPFFTTKEPGRGTGLGLSQVHGFIKQSGGNIRLYSEPGRGTAVKLYLPRHATGTTGHAVRPQPPEALPLAQKGETILVVEDEPVVRSGTVSMLEELGYVVLEADNGTSALRILESRPEVALLITDVVMPGMNGRQLADEATRTWPQLRVLYSSGYARNAIVHHGTLDPGVHLIAKPFTLEALAVKVAELLSFPVK
jgi:signal transduction histidine kinase